MKFTELTQNQKKQAADANEAMDATQNNGVELADGALDAIAGGYRPRYRPRPIPHTKK